MDGKNASGRKVSLLNDGPSRPSTSKPAPRLHDHSRTSSYSSQLSKLGSISSRSSNVASPALSPTSPRLARLNSSSSQSTGRDTPSPMTPSYPYDVFEQSKTISPYESYYRQNGSNYPAMPQPQDAVSQPYYHLPARHISYTPMESASYNGMTRPTLDTQFTFATPEPTTPISPMSTLATPTTAPAPSSTNTTPAAGSSSSSSSKAIKKKYPCPHAHRYSCPDTFTTSGHAARHGKKHTGEKNITCPTCHKAFTRKDNMKQHERTHKAPGSRNPDAPPPSTKAASSRPARGSRRKAVAPSAAVVAASPAEFEVMDFEAEGDLEAGMLGGGSSQSLAQRAGLEEGMTMSGLLADAMAESRPGSSSNGSERGEGGSPSGGLDALARAASGLSA